MRSPKYEPGDIVHLFHFENHGEPDPGFNSVSCGRSHEYGTRSVVVERITMGANDLWPNQAASMQIAWVRNVDDGVRWGCSLSWLENADQGEPS